jgi:AraC-like DNA-binding protein
MEIRIYRPRSVLLQQHIDFFYTLTRGQDEPPGSYLSFPGMNQVVCLYADTISEIEDERVRIRHARNGVLESRIVGKFNKTVCASYEGPVNELNTLFRPLAINAFLPVPLKDLAPGHFPVFDPYPDFMPEMRRIYDLPVIADRLAALENYWIAKWNGFNHPFLQGVLNEMMDPDLPERRISDISKDLGISRQTMHQHFERYICKTPQEFRKVVRFRKAITEQRSLSVGETLTGLSVAADYFDQSHMIRDFKALTGRTPGDFFKRVSRLGDGEISWLFI